MLHRLLLFPDAAPAAAAPTAPPAAAPAAPAPASAPAPAAAPPAAHDNPFADLDAAFAKDPTAPAPASDKGGKGPPPKEAPPAAPVAPAVKAPPVPKELRAQLDKVTGELKTVTSDKSALEAKIADYERRGKDTEVLTNQLAALNKEKEALMAENRALKHETSDDFKQKFEVPFSRLAERAKTVVEQIQIENEDGTSRVATWSDFTKLYSFNEFVATKEAKKMFGEEGAQVAMRYYNELHRLDDDKNTALESERTQWKEKTEKEQAQLITQREQVDTFWHTVNKELAESNPDYGDPPDDKELAGVRQKALGVFDAAPKSLKEKIIKDAHIRQRVGAFSVLKTKLTRAEAEIADLKKQLEDSKPQPPGRPRSAGGAPAAVAEGDFDEGLRKHMAA